MMVWGTSGYLLTYLHQELDFILSRAEGRPTKQTIIIVAVSSVLVVSHLIYVFELLYFRQHNYLLYSHVFSEASVFGVSVAIRVPE